jgi:RND family efflux transporter MFP subunit
MMRAMKRSLAIAVVLVAAPAVAAVHKVKPTRRDLPGYVLPALLVPSLRVELSAPVTGFVRDFLADVGTRVKRGQVLANVVEKWNAKPTPLYAPFDGVITTRSGAPGSYVVVGGPPLFVLIQDEVMHAIVAVPEREIVGLKIGALARIKLDAFPDRIYEGKVALIVPEIDPQSRAVTIEIHINNPMRDIWSGMLGRALIESSARKNALVVPRAAVSRDDAGWFVFRADGGRARRAAVLIGYDDPEWIEILSGIAESDVLLTSDSPLSDGAPVSP